MKKNKISLENSLIKINNRYYSLLEVKKPAKSKFLLGPIVRLSMDLFRRKNREKV